MENDAKLQTRENELSTPLSREGGEGVSREGENGLVQESANVPNTARENGNALQEAKAFGKFKNADEMAAAYAELEKAFTKKCQELGAVRKNGTSLGAEGVIAAAKDERVQRLVVASYLKSVNQGSVRLMSSKDGAGFAITPPHAPKTVKEAGKIAEKYLGKK